MTMLFVQLLGSDQSLCTTKLLHYFVRHYALRLSIFAYFCTVCVHTTKLFHCSKCLRNRFCHSNVFTHLVFMQRCFYTKFVHRKAFTIFGTSKRGSPVAHLQYGRAEGYEVWTPPESTQNGHKLVGTPVLRVHVSKSTHFTREITSQIWAFHTALAANWEKSNSSRRCAASELEHH